jgi:hypothetical protein
VFRDLPAGTYSSSSTRSFPPRSAVGVADRVRVVRDQAAWSNFFFLLGFLVLLPMFSRYRVGTFEAERWKDADFLSSGADFGSGMTATEETTDAAHRHDPQPGRLHAVQLRAVPGLEPVLRKRRRPAGALGKCGAGLPQITLA